MDVSGAYTYTVAGVAPCPSDQAIVTVSENTPPVAGADASLTVCSTSASTALFALLVGAQAGGTWSGPGNVAFNGQMTAVNGGQGCTPTRCWVWPPA